MLFEFNSFKESLSKHSDQEMQMLYTDYISIFGDTPLIDDQPFFKEYLNLIDYVPYRTPCELPDDTFDWGLLQKLIAGSFSIEYNYIFFDQSNSIPDLKLTIDFNGSLTSRTIDELTVIHVFRLFEILTEEQMKLAVIAVESLDEKEYILYKRDERIKLHKSHSKKLLNYDEFNQTVSYEKIKIKQLISLSFKKKL